MNRRGFLMEVTMKLQISLIAGLLALSAASSPALAGGDSPDRYDRWERQLRTRVNALHVYPEGAAKGAMGDVLVSFRIGDDGKPADIVIRQTSGQAIFDNAAVRLVAGLGKLGPVPASRGAIDRVTLKLSYGEPATLAEAKRMAKATAEERVANERRNRLIVSQAKELAARR
jgi:TonB family protein